LILFLSRRYEDCVAMCLRALELDPYTPQVHARLGRAYEQLGRHREAVDAYITPLTFSESNRDIVVALRAAAARGGLKGFWEQRLQQLLKDSEVPTYSVAMAYARLGDRDRALASLEKHFAERGAWIRGLKVQPEWDSLRPDPRFQALVRRASTSSASAPLVSNDASVR
jgi:tetratricopeptide (TPR) repeat protein